MILISARADRWTIIASSNLGLSKLVIPGTIRLSCSSIRIGSWTCERESVQDLFVTCLPDSSTSTYYIHGGGGVEHMIEYTFSDVSGIHWIHPEESQVGSIEIRLNQMPSFFISSDGTSFYQSVDFTVNRQATYCLVHHLVSYSKAPSRQFKIAVLSRWTRSTQRPRLAGYL